MITKIAVVTANLGEFDQTEVYSPQSVPYDFFLFTDENFPPRYPRRNTVRWEIRYLERGIRQGSRYLAGRYANELLKENASEINADKEFVDDLLVNSGIFMYKNSPEVQRMMKEWWYHISRYHIVDQFAFSYVLKKSGLRINVRPDNLYASPYLKHKGHIKHY